MEFEYRKTTMPTTAISSVLRTSVFDRDLGDTLVLVSTLMHLLAISYLAIKKSFLSVFLPAVFNTESSVAGNGSVGSTLF